MHREASRPEEESRVVIMPNLEVLMKLERSWIFSSVLGSSMFLALYLHHSSSAVGLGDVVGEGELTGQRAWSRCLCWSTTWFWRGVGCNVVGEKVGGVLWCI